MFDIERGKVVQEPQVTHVLEILEVFVEIENKTVLVLLYRNPGPVGSFLQDKCRRLVFSDFTLGQLLFKNVRVLDTTQQ